MFSLSANALQFATVSAVQLNLNTMISLIMAVPNLRASRMTLGLRSFYCGTRNLNLMGCKHRKEQGITCFLKEAEANDLAGMHNAAFRTKAQRN